MCINDGHVSEKIAQTDGLVAALSTHKVANKGTSEDQTMAAMASAAPSNDTLLLCAAEVAQEPNRPISYVTLCTEVCGWLFRGPFLHHNYFGVFSACWHEMCPSLRQTVVLGG